MNLVYEVAQITRNFASKGGKKNRLMQRKRMLSFAAFCQQKDPRINSFGQIGKRQVIQYWKANRELADSTLYNHHRALCELWRLAERKDLPPAPHKRRDKKLITKD